MQRDETADMGSGAATNNVQIPGWPWRAAGGTADSPGRGARLCAGHHPKHPPPGSDDRRGARRAGHVSTSLPAPPPPLASLLDQIGKKIDHTDAKLQSATERVARFYKLATGTRCRVRALPILDKRYNLTVGILVAVLVVLLLVLLVL